MNQEQVSSAPPRFLAWLPSRIYKPNKSFSLLVAFGQVFYHTTRKPSYKRAHNLTGQFPLGPGKMCFKVVNTRKRSGSNGCFQLPLPHSDSLGSLFSLPGNLSAWHCFWLSSSSRLAYMSFRNPNTSSLSCTATHGPCCSTADTFCKHLDLPKRDTQGWLISF